MAYRYSIAAMTTARWWGNLLRDTDWAYYLNRSRNQSSRHWHRKANLTPERIASFEQQLARFLDKQNSTLRSDEFIISVGELSINAPLTARRNTTAS